MVVANAASEGASVLFHEGLLEELEHARHAEDSEEAEGGNVARRLARAVGHHDDPLDREAGDDGAHAMLQTPTLRSSGHCNGRWHWHAQRKRERQLGLVHDRLLQFAFQPCHLLASAMTVRDLGIIYGQHKCRIPWRRCA